MRDGARADLILVGMEPADALVKGAKSGAMADAETAEESTGFAQTGTGGR